MTIYTKLASLAVEGELDLESINRGVPAMKLKRKHYTALHTAVREAAAWRGSLTGNYGDEPSMREEYERLAAFDSKIALMNEALRLIRDTMPKRKKK